MKSILSFLAILFITTSICSAQVGINTDTPDASSILDLSSTEAGFLLPRMTMAEKNAISNPAKGLMVFDTTNNTLEVNTGTPTSPVWSFVRAENNVTPKIVTFYGDLSGANNNINGVNDTFFRMPLGSSEVTEINTDVFTVLGDGRVRVEETGSYLINASISVEDLPPGDRKYILGVFLNGTASANTGTRLGYLSRGFASIPSGSTQFFGTSGTFTYFFTAGDVVSVEYVFNNDGNRLDGNLIHLGIAKL